MTSAARASAGRGALLVGAARDLGVGLVLGAAAKGADLLPGGVLASLTSTVALWVLVLALVARWSRSPARAAGAAVLLFLGVLVGYYAVTVIALRYPVTPRYVIAWTVAAVTLCPAVAAVLQRADRSRHVLAGAAVGLVAGAAFLDGSARRLLLAIGQPGLWTEALPVQAAFDVLVAVLVAVVLPQRARVRLVGAAVAVVAAVVLPPMIDQVLFGSGLLG